MTSFSYSGIEGPAFLLAWVTEDPCSSDSDSPSWIKASSKMTGSTSITPVLNRSGSSASASSSMTADLTNAFLSAGYFCLGTGGLAKLLDLPWSISSLNFYLFKSYNSC